MLTNVWPLTSTASLKMRPSQLIGGVHSPAAACVPYTTWNDHANELKSIIELDGKSTWIISPSYAEPLPSTVIFTGETVKKVRKVSWVD